MEAFSSESSNSSSRAVAHLLLHSRDAVYNAHNQRHEYALRSGFGTNFPPAVHLRVADLHLAQPYVFHIVAEQNDRFLFSEYDPADVSGTLTSFEMKLAPGVYSSSTLASLLVLKQALGTRVWHPESLLQVPRNTYHTRLDPNSSVLLIESTADATRQLVLHLCVQPVTIVQVRLKEDPQENTKHLIFRCAAAVPFRAGARIDLRECNTILIKGFEGILHEEVLVIEVHGQEFIVLGSPELTEEENIIPHVSHPVKGYPNRRSIFRHSTCDQEGSRFAVSRVAQSDGFGEFNTLLTALYVGAGSLYWGWADELKGRLEGDLPPQLAEALPENGNLWLLNAAATDYTPYPQVLYTDSVFDMGDTQVLLEKGVYLTLVTTLGFNNVNMIQLCGAPGDGNYAFGEQAERRGEPLCQGVPAAMELNIHFEHRDLDMGVYSSSELTQAYYAHVRARTGTPVHNEWDVFNADATVLHFGERQKCNARLGKHVSLDFQDSRSLQHLNGVFEYTLHLVFEI
jgi:hypothetical protein